MCPRPLSRPRGSSLSSTAAAFQKGVSGKRRRFETICSKVACPGAAPHGPGRGAMVREGPPGGMRGEALAALQQVRAIPGAATVRTAAPRACPLHTTPWRAQELCTSYSAIVGLETQIQAVQRRQHLIKMDDKGAGARPHAMARVRARRSALRSAALPLSCAHGARRAYEPPPAHVRRELPAGRRQKPADAAQHDAHDARR